MKKILFPLLIIGGVFYVVKPDFSNYELADLLPVLIIVAIAFILPKLMKTKG